MGRWFLPVLVVFLVSCGARPPESLYYWKTTLDWRPSDTARLAAAGVDQVGLRLFDWGPRGEEGPLVVRTGLPPDLDVVPVVYVTTDRLGAWASDPSLDPVAEASRLMAKMDQALVRAWPGTPRAWQLDADWTTGNRDSWFAVARAFGDLVHRRGGRFEVTVRLHQYRDRATQGIPPADAGVLMLYGAGDLVLDPPLAAGYLAGDPYPLALVPAFPAYTQVRQLNGYGRLVALHRLGPGATLPLGDLRDRGGGRFDVVRRTNLAGRPLMAKDVLVVDRATAGTLARVAALPAVAALRKAAGGRVWFFDYDPDGDSVPGLD